MADLGAARQKPADPAMLCPIDIRGRQDSPNEIAVKWDAGEQRFFASLNGEGEVCFLVRGGISIPAAGIAWGDFAHAISGGSIQIFDVLTQEELSLAEVQRRVNSGQGMPISPLKCRGNDDMLR